MNDLPSHPNEKFEDLVGLMSETLGKMADARRGRKDAVMAKLYPDKFGKHADTKLTGENDFSEVISKRMSFGFIYSFSSHENMMSSNHTGKPPAALT